MATMLTVIALSSAQQTPLLQTLTPSVIEDIISIPKQASTTSTQDIIPLSLEDLSLLTTLYTLIPNQLTVSTFTHTVIMTPLITAILVGMLPKVGNGC